MRMLTVHLIHVCPNNQCVDRVKTIYVETDIHKNYPQTVNEQCPNCGSQRLIFDRNDVIEAVNVHTKRLSDLNLMKLVGHVNCRITSVDGKPF